MPRPVVPMRPAPLRASRARSSAPCDGRISAALSASFRFSGVTSTPFLRMASISSINAQGSTTTPLPMIDNLPGRTTPDGNRLSLYSTLPMTSVWPALWPPWKRTTTSARSESQSTILPLPSSPHWAPTTATLAIQSLPQPSALGASSSEDMGAAEAARLRRPIGGGFEGCDGDPAAFAQDNGAVPVGAERQQQAALRDGIGQCSQNGIGVERETGCRLGCGRVPRLIAAAATQFPARPASCRTAGEKREADAGVVFEAAILDRVDGYLKIGCRVPEPVEHHAEPHPFGPRAGRQIKPVERGERRIGRPRRRQQSAEQCPGLARRGGDGGGVLVVERRAQGGGAVPRQAIGLGHPGHQGRHRDVDR